ncbi:MAG: HPP family protein [Cyanobacteria bacterium]|nr:HPP family protein [Cyanobacteriota bacterium]
MKLRWAALAIAVYLALITVIARATHMPYVLFPELGALGWVIFGDARHPWARSPVLLMLTPFLAAVLGLVITRHLPYGPVAVLLDVAGSLLVIGALRSPIAPALSAGLLPLALGIHTWTYPFSILIGTGGLALLIKLRQRWSRGRVSPHSEGTDIGPAPRSSLPPLKSWAPAFGVFLLGGLVLERLIGSPLVLFPPLLVIAFEMIVHRQHCPWRGRYFSVLVVANSAAVVGLLLVRTLGVVPAAASLAVLATLALLRLARLPFPPALGLALLPFVILQPPLAYPLFTLAGSFWLLLVVAVQEAIDCGDQGGDQGGGQEGGDAGSDGGGFAGDGGSSGGVTGTA